MERHRLPDGGHQLDAVARCKLVHVVDRKAFHDPEVHRLADVLAQPPKVRMRNALQIHLGANSVGQTNDLAGEAVSSGLVVLSDVTGLNQRAEQAGGGCLVEVNQVRERRRSEAGLVGRRKCFENIESAGQGARSQIVAP